MPQGEGQDVPMERPGCRPRRKIGTRQLTPPAPGANSSGQLFEGPWAILRLLDRAQIQPTAQPEKMLATFNMEGRRAQFEIISGSVQNPLGLTDLDHFRCPGKL